MIVEKVMPSEGSAAFPEFWEVEYRELLEAARFRGNV